MVTRGCGQRMMKSECLMMQNFSWHEENFWRWTVVIGYSTLCVYSLHLNGTLEKCLQWDFRGGPVVESLPPNAGDEGSILVGELRSHMLRDN